MGQLKVITTTSEGEVKEETFEIEAEVTNESEDETTKERKPARKTSKRDK